MFLLKRATRVLLVVTIFGILLPDLYIQPAQADGEGGGGPAEAGVQADVVAKVMAALQHQAKAKAQGVAEPAKLSGLKCYECGPCKSNTDLGDKTLCDPGVDSCAWGEVKELDGRKKPVRSCDAPGFLGNFSCDKFTPVPQLAGEIRVCICKGEFCNNKDATTGTSSFSAQLIVVAASLFGSLMMK